MYKSLTIIALNVTEIDWSGICEETSQSPSHHNKILQPVEKSNDTPSIPNENKNSDTIICYR